MAEAVRDKAIKNNLTGVKNEKSGNVECAVCLQNCVHPAELPCGHIFCYLCIKGIVNQGRRCAMCRQDIPVDYLDKPRLLKPVDTENGNRGFEDGHLWFYEGHNGWWQYDERTSLELESAYQKAERCCELLIAGFLYIADFDSMLQYRRNDPSRRRRIKRDLATICSKGIAGLKATKDTVPLSSSTDLVSNVLIPDLQNLHISGQPLLTPLHNTNLSALSNLNSLSSSQSISRMVPDFRHTERNLSLVGSHDVPLYYSNLQVEPVTNNIHAARNLDIDPSLSNRLDWTIEQIEALNLELSNDYENLFRDVNNLSSLHDTTNSSGTNNEASNSLINSPRRGHVSVASNSTFTSVQGSSRRIPSSNEHLPVTQNAVSPTITERILVRPSVLTNVDCPQSLTRPLQKLSRSKHKKLSPK